MESPVVVDKPPEYHGNERGFPFEDEDGSGAWSELAARHPDIAARLRQRPSTWARKRRPSSQDTEDFGDRFSGFDRFPFDDIPPEFREHFPTRWNRGFGSREEQPHQPYQSEPQPQPQQPQASHPPPQPHPQPPHQQTTATQTEPHIPEPEPQQFLPQYGLRNTVDLGQKSALDPSLVDADERNQRSMSAPPDNRADNMSSQNHSQNEHPQQHQQQASNVRVIPIMVEGRDEPVINRNVDHGTHFGESKPAHASPHPHPHPHSQPHIDREQYFNDDGPITYNQPPNFSRSFGTPFNKFRQGPQPFVQQKVYPQSATAFARGASPQRSQSPKPPQPQHEEHFVKVPVHHEHEFGPKPEPQARQQPKPQQPKPQQQPAQQQQQPPQLPPQQPTPPQPPKPAANDPITLILSVQTDVLNLMSDVENFKGSKKDKSYMFLDEMLTRNLIKLDNIETEGKENIRQARKEAIKCIQKCIAVLEAKAREGSAALALEQTQVAEMKENESNEEKAAESGEVEMAEPKEATVEDQPEQPKVEEQEKPIEATASQEASPPAADTRPDEKAAETTVENKNKLETKEKVDKKCSPKKGAKNVKKRDKSKDKGAAKDSEEGKTEDSMQVDGKGDSQKMEVDAPSQ